MGKIRDWWEYGDSARILTATVIACLVGTGVWILVHPIAGVTVAFIVGFMLAVMFFV